MENSAQWAIADLEHTFNSFIIKLNAEQTSSHWLPIIENHYQEISNILLNPESSKEDNESSKFLTPKASSTIDQGGNVFLFSPYIDEKAKIPCTLLSCKSTFMHRRSYREHMKKFHANLPIDYSVRDPPGTCRLLSPITGQQCNSRLPLRSIYYHMQVIHDILRPDEDHVLLGFDTTNVESPRAVFVRKGQQKDEIQKHKRKTLSTVKNTNVIPFEIGSSVSINIDKTKDQDLPNRSLKTRRSNSTPMNLKPAKKRKLNITPESSLSESDVEEEKSYLNNISFTSEGDNDINDKDPDIFDADTQPLSSSDPETSSDNLNFEKASPLAPVPEDKLDALSSQEFSDPNSPGKSEEAPKSITLEHSDEYQNASFDSEKLPQLMDKSEIPDLNSEDVKEYSDWEDGDDSEITSLRRQNKKVRYQKRNIAFVPVHESSKNKGFIQDFIQFMKKHLTSTSKTSNITITKTVNELYKKEDSLLEFETKKNDEFSLELYRKFHSNQFRHLTYPLDWLLDTCGDDGSKGLERLKSHSYLRSYILYEVSQLESDTDSTLKHDVRLNIEAVANQITSSNLYKRFKNKEKTMRNKKANAQLILQPSKTVNIEQLVKTWNASFQKSELDKDYNFIYENSMKTKEISVRNLTKYSQYSRITLMMRWLDPTQYNYRCSPIKPV